jgi:hypothetical protein
MKKKEAQSIILFNKKKEKKEEVECSACYCEYPASDCF